VVLLCVYGALLLFQFRTHTDVWGVPGEKTPRRRQKVPRGNALEALARFGATMSATVGSELSQQNPIYDHDADENYDADENKEPALSGWVLVVYLIIHTL